MFFFLPPFSISPFLSQNYNLVFSFSPFFILLFRLKTSILYFLEPLSSAPFSRQNFNSHFSHLKTSILYSLQLLSSAPFCQIKILCHFFQLASSALICYCQIIVLKFWSPIKGLIGTNYLSNKSCNQFGVILCKLAGSWLNWYPQVNPKSFLTLVLSIESHILAHENK